MLLDIAFFLENASVILLIVLAVLVVKSAVGSIAVAVLKYSPRTVLITGLSLFQVGEFAFILSKVGIEYGLLSAETNQYFLAVSIVSMLLTPFVIMFAEDIADKFLSTKVAKVMTEKAPSKEESNDDVQTDHLSDHLVIIGYGVNGSNLAKAAHQSNIPYIAIELNATTVLREKKNGIPIIFGDAAEPHILETVNLKKARAAVVAISDPEATKAITTNIREFSSSIYLLVRTRYVKETSELLALGADEVIPEEFETSVEIFSRVLHNFLVPEDDIAQFVELVRSDNYDIFQNTKELPRTYRPTKHPDFNITSLRVIKDSGKLIGKSLADSNLRANYGVNLLAINRKEELLENITPDEKILRGDILYVSGKQEDIEEFNSQIC